MDSQRNPLSPPVFFGNQRQDYSYRREGNAKERSRNPNSKGFELVNPVQVWLVNDRLLVLKCFTDDLVYIDTRYNTIVNQSLDGTVPRKVQQRILDTPDYFEYIVAETAVEIFS